MKIATWNIERLKHKNKLQEMKDICNQINADIFVLTETDTQFNLGYKSILSTNKPANAEFSVYSETERRVEICTNYDIIKQHRTFDKQTALCAEIVTDKGNLILYSVIIGVYGNRHNNFKNDLPLILEDISRLSGMSKPLCVCGDFNMSFCDNYYFTKTGRTAIEEAFIENDLVLLTRKQPECIDHIAVSQSFVSNSKCSITEWNLDKCLSDHKGISVEITI
jgi:endonuclease/exonuclease/phosphatase family metal-dependent hydrolase